MTHCGTEQIPHPYTEIGVIKTAKCKASSKIQNKWETQKNGVDRQADYF